MAGLCKWGLGIVGALYLVALALLLIGQFGLLGQERDRLAGVFLLPLGLPWTLMTGSAPDALKPWLASLAPALNLVILFILCRTSGRDGRLNRARKR